MGFCEALFRQPAPLSLSGQPWSLLPRARACEADAIPQRWAALLVARRHRDEGHRWMARGPVATWAIALEEKLGMRNADED
jgi:hypothetical protein